MQEINEAREIPGVKSNGRGRERRIAAELHDRAVVARHWLSQQAIPHLDLDDPGREMRRCLDTIDRFSDYVTDFELDYAAIGLARLVEAKFDVTDSMFGGPTINVNGKTCSVRHLIDLGAAD